MVAMSGMVNSSIAGDPSPARVFGDWKHPAGSSESAAGCKATQCAASSIDLTSDAPRKFFSARNAASTSAGESGRVMVAAVAVMGLAKQGAPTSEPENPPLPAVLGKEPEKLRASLGDYRSARRR